MRASLADPGKPRRLGSGILKVVDDGMANITAALRASGRWDDALLWISSDNGGVGPGNNHPRE